MLIAFERATLRLQDRLILPDTSWQIREGEQWAVLGPNGSGKSTLLRAILGDVPVVRGTLRTVQDIGHVSFELHQQLAAREAAMDPARWFSGSTDSATKAESVLFDGGQDGREPDRGQFERLVSLFELKRLLPRPFRHLSTGEVRKLLMARALLSEPRVLALDEPFDGLDEASRATLSGILERLAAQGTQLILVTHRAEEIIAPITHLLCLKNGRIFLKGRRARVFTRYNMERLFGTPEAVRRPQHALKAKRPGEALIEMRDVSVRYGDCLILDRLSWIMRKGENWCVAGANGSGKTTLLSLVAGDNPQAYANDIRLFGVQRGSGESIWDIKSRIGLMSSEFQIAYRRPLTGLEVVLSGFHDSIGLYRHYTGAQQETAEAWLRRLGMEQFGQRSFEQLSYGEQRMLLLARAMVKSPELLILDEPCQGLDAANRRRILELVDRVGLETETNLIYVTHHREEIPRCVTHVLNLGDRRPAG